MWRFWRRCMRNYRDDRGGIRVLRRHHRRLMRRWRRKMKMEIRPRTERRWKWIHGRRNQNRWWMKMDFNSFKAKGDGKDGKWARNQEMYEYIMTIYIKNKKVYAGQSPPGVHLQSSPRTLTERSLVTTGETTGSTFFGSTFSTLVTFVSTFVVTSSSTTVFSSSLRGRVSFSSSSNLPAHQKNSSRSTKSIPALSNGSFLYGETFIFSSYFFIRSLICAS